MKRQTLQKTIILDALARLHDHPTPTEVYEEIHKVYPSISRATVFRVLAGECEDGEAQRVYTVDGLTRYERGIRKHYHISCRLCGRVADVEMPYQEGLEALIRSAGGFTVEQHAIEFIGVCPGCQGRPGENK